MFPDVEDDIVTPAGDLSTPCSHPLSKLVALHDLAVIRRESGQFMGLSEVRC